VAATVLGIIASTQLGSTMVWGVISERMDIRHSSLIMFLFQSAGLALVLATSLTSVKQWRRELLDKTTLRPDDIAEYTGEQKSTGPVTLTTYQILTWRADRESEFPHLELFRARSWGLVIYDEVHLLPAPVFRATADLQARRRLGIVNK